MGFIRVVQPGMLTTVQDLGREGFAALGVASGGALDTLSFRIGNRLVGNPDGAPALEMTLIGGTFLFEDPAVVAMTGGDLTASIESAAATPRTLKPWTAERVSAGETLRAGPIVRGVRTYLCLAGGLVVPNILGSASTHLGAAFGGFGGRALRAGDRLEWRAPAAPSPVRTFDQAVDTLAREVLVQRTIRCVAGVHTAHFDEPSLEAFWGSSYTVTAQSDRMGLRLDGTKIAPRSGAVAGGRMISEGMPSGAVQMPEGGQPIVLLADRPTTGGYPVIACVTTADLPVLGQLRPRDSIRFQPVSLDEARTLYRDREHHLDTAIPPS